MIILEQITMTEFIEALKRTRTVVFPFGTLEEHGSHLPLNTDTMIVHEIIRAAAKEREFFLAPPIPYGVCTTTGDHPGTIGISPETLRMISADLMRDVYRKGLNRILLISGHGGSLHMGALKESAELLVRELPDVQIGIFLPYDEAGKELAEITETPNDGHAGELETSLVLFFAPNLVKGSSPEEYPQFPRPFVTREKIKYWPGGVWGNPGKATAEKGRKAAEAMVKRVIEIIDAMNSRPEQ